MTLNLKITKKVPCVVCKQDVYLSEATAGALYADGRQAFACNEHALIRAAWLVAWARFAIEQQKLKSPAIKLGRAIGV